jgi:pseudouridine synthase
LRDGSARPRDLLAASEKVYGARCPDAPVSDDASFDLATIDDEAMGCEEIKDTSGLLLITDQGDLMHRFTSLKSDCEKVYEATVDHDLDPALIEVFARGQVMLRGEEEACLLAKLEIVTPRSARLTRTEGRYHQVRRKFASQGCHVETLHRMHFGDLEEGKFTPLRCIGSALAPAQ